MATAVRTGDGASQPTLPRLAVAAHLAEGTTPDALLEGVAETQRTPVLLAELVADVLLGRLPLVLEEVPDQRDLTVQPPLVLFLVLAGRAREGGVRARAHRSPPVNRVRAG